MKRPSGVAMVIVLLVISIMFVIGAAMVAISTANLSEVSSSVRDKQAFFAANAGVADALENLKQNTSYNAAVSDTLMANQAGSYSYVVTNNWQGGTPVTSVNGINVPPGYVYVLATGRSQPLDPVRPVLGATSRQVGVMLMGFNPLGYGVFGVTGVAMQNKTIDAYDSSNSMGYPANAMSGSQDLNVGTLTNGISVVTTNPPVPGNASFGPPNWESNPTSYVTSTSQAIAGTFASARMLPVPPVLPTPTPPTITWTPGATPTPANFIAPGTYGSLNLTGGQTVTLGSGSYVFTNGVSLNGGSTISIDASAGPVAIYFGGAFNTTGGNVVGNTGSDPKPGQLLVFGLSTAVSVDVGGSTASAMAVYAPSAAVTLHGSADFFGSLSGRTFLGQGSSGGMHYDVALMQNNQFTGFTPTGWQRF
ncbi:MAG: pilus assembly PilX family protein [Candidatus Xenobia bacterium]